MNFPVLALFVSEHLDKPTTIAITLWVWGELPSMGTLNLKWRSAAWM